MLNAERDQHQNRADEEGGVQAKAQALLEEGEIDELDLPGSDRGLGREQSRENVAGGDATTDGKDRRPGEPVAPHRMRRDELGVTHPSRGTVDRGAARLVREQARDLGIGEGLDEAEEDRERPNQDGRRAHRGGNAADGEQHERWDAAVSYTHLTLPTI